MRSTKRLLTKHPDLNVPVNNAGIMRAETLEADLLGPIRLTDALVDRPVARPDAVIVAVSSGLAFVPSVASPVYAATKAAIHSHAISLRVASRGMVELIELVPPGVQTALTPGQET